MPITYFGETNLTMETEVILFQSLLFFFPQMYANIYGNVFKYNWTPQMARKYK